MVAAVLGPRRGPDPSGVFVSISQFCVFHVWSWLLGSPQKIGDGLLDCDGFSNVVRLAGRCLQVQVCARFIGKLTLFECLRSCVKLLRRFRSLQFRSPFATHMGRFLSMLASPRAMERQANSDMSRKF